MCSRSKRDRNSARAFCHGLCAPLLRANLALQLFSSNAKWHCYSPAVPGPTTAPGCCQASRMHSVVSACHHTSCKDEISLPQHASKSTPRHHQLLQPRYLSASVAVYLQSMRCQSMLHAAHSPLPGRTFATCHLRCYAHAAVSCSAIGSKAGHRIIAIQSQPLGCERTQTPGQ